MAKKVESMAVELNNISSALEFIYSSIECHEAEGREIDAGGLAFLVKLIGGRSRRTAEFCWSIANNTGISDSSPGE